MDWTVWARGSRSHALTSQVSRSHTVQFLFVGGCVKGLVYVPPLPKDEDELKARKTEAVATIDNAMLECVWRELD